MESLLKDSNNVFPLCQGWLKQFVCVSTNGQEWYYYNGFLWKHDQSMIELRKFMSTVLLPMFEEYHKTPKTISNLKTHTFKKQVIQESVELFYDVNFLNQLDADPNLIGFGVTL